METRSHRSSRTTRVSSCVVELLLQAEVCPGLPIQMLRKAIIIVVMVRLPPIKPLTLSLAQATARLVTKIIATTIKKMVSTVPVEIETRQQATELMMTLPMENTANTDLSTEARAHRAPTAHQDPLTKVRVFRATPSLRTPTTVRALQAATAPRIPARALPASTELPLPLMEPRTPRANTAHPLQSIEQRSPQASTVHLLPPTEPRALTARPLPPTEPRVRTASPLPPTEPRALTARPLPPTEPRALTAHLPPLVAKVTITALKVLRVEKLALMAIPTLLIPAPECRHLPNMIQQPDTTQFSEKVLFLENTQLQRAIQRKSPATTRKKSQVPTLRCTETLTISLFTTVRARAVLAMMMMIPTRATIRRPLKSPKTPPIRRSSTKTIAGLIRQTTSQWSPLTKLLRAIKTQIDDLLLAT